VERKKRTKLSGKTQVLHWWKNKKPAEHLQFWLELFTSLSEIYNVNNFIIIDFWHTVNSAFCRILSILVEAKKN